MDNFVTRLHNIYQDLKFVRKIMPVTQNKKSWKVIQKREIIKKRTKLGLAILGLLIAIILVGNLVKLVQTFFSPWNISHTSTKNYIWNGEFNLNLIAKKKSSIFVISYKPKDEKLIVFEIPGNLIVDVPFGFGSWQIRSVYELGETNKKGSGVDLLKKSAATLLGAPMDGFLDLERLDVSNIDQLVEFLGQNFIFSLPSLTKIKTDLTLWELVRFKIGSMVRFDKMEKLNLEDVLDNGKLNDGSEIYRADPVKIDSLNVYFEDRIIKSELLSIAIFNATDSVGLAQRVARMIGNIGGNVIITSNTKEVNKSFVFGQNSKTLERLEQIFGSCRKSEIDCDRIPMEEIASSRAQINVILGDDFLNR